MSSEMTSPIGDVQREVSMKHLLRPCLFILQEMALPITPDPSAPYEIGRLLKMERTKQGLSMEELCKKMGVRIQQIEAVESGNTAYFQINTHPFTWFARLYAKKLGVNLPDSALNSSTSPQQTDTNTSQKPPLYLIKNKDAS
jgi:transcriptional regulator with XRE-family HTH domain